MPLSTESTSPEPTTLPPNVDELKGAQKAATLLIALGVDTASKVLRALNDDEVRRISIEIAKLRNASSDLVEGVLMEYRDMALAHEYIAQGGTPYARQVLREALGPHRADEIMMQVEAAMEVSAFHLLQTAETTQLTNFLQNEHPQTAALILAHLNPRKAAEIISELAPEQQNEIMYRLATMGKTSPDLLNDIEDVIRNQLGSIIGAELSAMGGIEQVAEILNSTSRTSERSIMDAMRERSEDLALSIKNLMFVFDDLVQIHGRDLQRILTEVEQKDLALALKAASESLRQKVYANVSDRVAQSLQEEIELMGQVRVRDVEEAQHRILDVAQHLEMQDEIVLSRGAEETLI